MNKIKQGAILLVILSLLFTNCRKKDSDTFYDRPESLEPPIYQVLTAKGNFKSLLALIDKGGYKKTLSNAGYWTMFAPNDAAFENYFTTSNTSLDKIDSTVAQAIIQYLLVYNAFDKIRIDDYQSNIGWVPDNAFRRRTAYYTGFYNDTMVNGQVVKAIAANRNGSGTPYISADNNNKYIPYFTDVYFAAKKLSASDYNYFFPNAQFTGFNVEGAKVLNKDIAAENGVIHELDKVVLPLPSIDEYLKSKSEYNEFRKLYYKYVVNFVANNDATQRYQLLSGNSQQVYVKAFNSLLAYAPNNENHLKVQDNDGQADSWSIFVPRNAELLSYIRNVLLEYYGKDLANIDKLPPQVLIDFLNAHMWQTAVWPSKFNNTFNFLGEEARFNAQSDVTERKILSNGMFYGTSKVQEANVFSSVYSRAYLDPKYSIMTRLLDAELKFLINSPNQQFTLFMMSDEVLKAAGYDYNAALNEWGYTPPGGTRTGGEGNRQRLLRILNTSLFQTPKGELNNLSGSGTIAAYNGEVINFSNNQLFSSGSVETRKTILVDSSRTVRNGTVYYINNLLTFADSSIGTQIRRLGSATTSDFNYFWQLFQNSSLFTNINDINFAAINGTTAGSLYTVFVPTNAAIMQAVKDGVLPGNKTTGAPLFNPLSTSATYNADRLAIERFIQYHILNKRTVIPDGKDSGGFETLLKNGVGDALTVTVISQTGSLQVTDMNNRRANVLMNQSNNLSNRTVIHLLDNYLKYSL
ncbi:MAG TPA: fasciclin domain-containing protein [Chitinophagaceae bacterium]|nr:fasciclin domain-containing protein [Chitinophagaceae bacterium]